MELVAYFSESFGSEDKLVYGTAHELSFVLLLFCLNELGLVGRAQYEQLVHHVFVKYIKLTRKLRMTYSLEPSGPKESWGLDNYNFLPFLFGGAQLINNEITKNPSDIHDEIAMGKIADDFIYLGNPLFYPFYSSSSVRNPLQKKDVGLVG